MPFLDTAIPSAAASQKSISVTKMWTTDSKDSITWSVAQSQQATLALNMHPNTFLFVDGFRPTIGRAICLNSSSNDNPRCPDGFSMSPDKRPCAMLARTSLYTYTYHDTPVYSVAPINAEICTQVLCVHGCGSSQAGSDSRVCAQVGDKYIITCDINIIDTMYRSAQVAQSMYRPLTPWHTFFDWMVYYLYAATSMPLGRNPYVFSNTQGTPLHAVLALAGPDLACGRPNELRRRLLLDEHQ